MFSRTLIFDPFVACRLPESLRLTSTPLLAPCPSLMPFLSPLLTRLRLQTHVEEGAMVCRGCGHVYQISAGIPNMVSHLNDPQCRATG